MSLLSLQKVSLIIAGHQLLKQVDWQIQPRDKIALVGRNGAGKSSLLKLLQGKLAPESGQVLLTNGLRIAELLQEVPDFKQSKQKVGDYLNQSATHLPSWDAPHSTETIALRLGLDIQKTMSQLSGGMVRRVLLAAALVTAPDILLLDEPTNHLDVHSIEWLESYLKQYQGALILVTHDRAFLNQVVNQIIELDRANLYFYHCDYATFLDRREARLMSELRHAWRWRKLGSEKALKREGREMKDVFAP